MFCLQFMKDQVSKTNSARLLFKNEAVPEVFMLGACDQLTKFSIVTQKSFFTVQEVNRNRKISTAEAL